MKTSKIASFLRTALLFIALAACGSIFLLNLFYLPQLRYDASEKVIIDLCPLQNLLPLASALLLTAIVSQLGSRLEKINQRRLFFVLAAIYTLVALYLVLNVDPKIRADAKWVHLAAENYRAGDYRDFFQGSGNYSDFTKGGYLYRYPHQLGLLLYDLLLMGFSSNPQWNMLVNFLMVLSVNYTIFRISQELFQSKAISLLTMLCSFAFLPQLFFILFVYGLIPGFCCICAAFLQALRFVRTQRKRNLLALVLLCALAIVLKSNYAIGILAIAIFLVLQMLREKPTFKMTTALVCVLLCLVVPGKLVRMGFEAKTGAQLDQGTPAILYVAMGTDIDNYASAAGWYNGTVVSLYDQAEQNPEAAAQLGTEKLKENIDKIKERPRDAMIFLLNKTVSQWCDPLFESVWTGPLEVCGQKTHTRILESLYGGGIVEDMMTTLCKIVTFGIWLGVCLFLIFRGRNGEGWELFLMYFLGGLIFHSFWEGKSQYTYPYVFVLIPCAMAGLWELSQRMKKLFSKKEIIP